MLTICGASDDLIEVEGANLREEFSTDDTVIGVSDGTLLRVKYTDDGVWTVTVIARGDLFVEVRPNLGPDSDDYSDKAVFEDGVRWVVFGDHYAKKRT